MIPAVENDHSSGAPNRLTSQYKGRPRIEGLLTAVTRPFDELEGAAWDVILKRRLGVATAEQLDVLGRVVGEPRKGRSDAEYEAVLRLVIRARRSNGRSEDVLAVLKLSGLEFAYEEHFPAGFRAEIFGTPNGFDVAFWVLVAKALGVRGAVVFTPESRAETFALEHVGGPVVAGNVWASTTEPTMGFPLASVRTR